MNYLIFLSFCFFRQKLFIKMLQIHILVTYNTYMKNSKRFLFILLLIVGLSAACYGTWEVAKFVRDTNATMQSTKPFMPGSESSEVQKETLVEALPSPTRTPAEVPTASPKPYVSPYADFFTAYPDVVAWLDIPDTGISYPVMWTPGDEEYYLYRNYDGTDNQNGSLILDTDSSLSPITTNLIIHGHNMRSGAMFGTLLNYKDQTYYEQHKEMLLFTQDGERKYEVIAAFRSKVYYKSDVVFKYYKFFQADTEEEFKDFYDNIKALSLYDTGVTAEFGDRFITLSTCTSYVDNGRFVVVAKEITDTSNQE